VFIYHRNLRVQHSTIAIERQWKYLTRRPEKEREGRKEGGRLGKLRFGTTLWGRGYEGTVAEPAAKTFFTFFAKNLDKTFPVRYGE
jgi:hypothetical protein